MISEHEKDTIVSIAEQFKVKKILLFGSSILESNDATDIDLAVDGVNSKDFFQFYGELLFKLKKSVDLIDLSSQSMFNDLVRREGIVIYG